MPLKISFKASEVDKHEWDINHLLYFKGKLYSASDDGKIKVWSSDLKFEGEVQAHPCSIYCLTASDDSLYSCSNDGTIKTWELETLKEKKTVVNDPETEFWRIGFSNGCLFSGDNSGTIRVFKNDKHYGLINIAEPIKDMAIDGARLFTSNLLDVVVTQTMIEGEKIHYGAKKVISGRAPLTLVRDKLCFSSRDGKSIVVHENDEALAFPKYAEKIDVHELIINALTGASWNGSDVLFSGGWDKVLKKWILENKNIVASDNLSLEFVITNMVAGESGQLFVGGENGNLIRVDMS